jgi:hypothetical protein
MMTQRETQASTIRVMRDLIRSVIQFALSLIIQYCLSVCLPVSYKLM